MYTYVFCLASATEVKFSSVMHARGFKSIDYIDDYIGVALPSIAFQSFDCLHQLMHELGLDISHRNLVEPSIRVVCLGILMGTENDFPS